MKKKLAVVPPRCECCGKRAFYNATFERDGKEATLRLCFGCNMTAKVIHEALGGTPVATT